MSKAAKKNTKPDDAKPSIPGAENRMASAEETRAPGGPGGKQAKGHQFRGERRFVTKIPIVEDGRHHPAQSVIRLTAHRANQLGPDKIAPHQGESYTDKPKEQAKTPPAPPAPPATTPPQAPEKNEGDDKGDNDGADDKGD
jgi:hypothetical protein